MLSISVGSEFRRSCCWSFPRTRPPTLAERAPPPWPASPSRSFYRAYRALSAPSASTAAPPPLRRPPTPGRPSCVVIVFSPPPLTVLAFLKRSDVQTTSVSPTVLPNTVTCRSLALVPTRAFWGIYPVPETSGVLLWIRPVGSACVRSIRLRARFRTRCGRRKNKNGISKCMHFEPSSATGYTTPSHRVGIHHSIPWRRAWIAPVFTPFGPASVELFALQKGRIGTHSVVKIFAHSDMHAPLL